MSDRTLPQISCVIPTFNRGTLLEGAIRSVKAQTFSEWELIIVDNGSTDNTSEIVDKFQKNDKRIIYCKCDRKGTAAARNYGVSLAKGLYVAFLDDDDVSLPHRFETQLEAIKKSGKKFVVSGYEIRARSDNSLIAKRNIELRGFGVGYPSRWLISKALFDECNGFDEELLTMEDPEFSYRVARHEIFAFNSAIVTVMYPSPDSISSGGKALIGKELMMQKSGHLMHPIEAAVWYYFIGLEHFNQRSRKEAMTNLYRAVGLDKSIIYRLGYFFALLSFPFGGIILKINLKVLRILGNLRKPTLVNHIVIE